MDYWTSSPGPLQTGIGPTSQPPSPRQVTEKEKVDIWFCDQLSAMKGDDAFICLMVCFPLIEAMIRHDLQVPDEEKLTLSDDSPALHWFAKFLSIPDSDARRVWDAFRNGLAHRAMIKDTISYVLKGEKSGRVAKIEGDSITLYVWELRDAVVFKLRTKHRHLWTESSPLPGIYKSS